MIQPDQISLANSRLIVAQTRLSSAVASMNAGCLRDSLHSAYYAAYTAIRALLNLHGVEQRKHTGNISKF